MADLEDKLTEIEERLLTIEKRLMVHEVLPSQPDKAIPAKPPLAQPQKIKQVHPLASWLKGNWIIAMGILLVILAISWFISYAFANNWVNEMTRVVLCLTTGIAICLWGTWRIREHLKSGQALIILGTIASLLSIYAGHQLYGLIPASYAFALMVVIAVFLATIAVKRSLEGLAFVSILMALVVPLLVSDHPRTTLLINYVLLVDIVALFMFLARGWSWPLQVAWPASFGYASGFFAFQMSVFWSVYDVTFSTPLTTSTVYLYIGLFYLLFVLPSGYSACGKIVERLSLRGAPLLITTTLALIYWVESWVSPHSAIAWYCAAALLSFYFGYMLFKNWDIIDEPKGLLAATMTLNVMLFAAMATSSLLTIFEESMASGVYFNVKVILYLAESTAAIAIGRSIFRSPVVVTGLSLYSLIPLSLLVLKYPEILHAPLFSLDFLVLCLATASFVFSTWIVYKFQSETPTTFQKLVRNTLGIFASIFSMNVIWNVCYNVVPGENLARGVALVIYILAAEVLIFVGNVKKLKSIRLAGMAVLIFVIGRLLLLEAWLMPVGVRTTTFIVAGLLLIGTAFFDRKYKNPMRLWTSPFRQD